MNIDLHCHTNVSDGTLTPDELIHLAQKRGVDILSITDHDTLDAYSKISSIPASLKLISGIEFSSQWRGQGIHIVGLNIDVTHPKLQEAVAQQSIVRDYRALKIADRLAKKGFIGCMEGAKKFGSHQIGRPHFAQHLVEIGAVKDTKEAFKKYLGAGKIGDIKDGWPSIDEIVSWIKLAGGIAVLAHPKKYSMTRTKLLELISDFRSAGGEGMEVISGYQDRNITKDLAKLCNNFELLASCGSDFHDINRKWAALGMVDRIPESCNPIWQAWL
jgi:hypothetical protein